MKENDSLCNDSNCTYKGNYHGHYELDGSPVPLARARFGNKRVWDSQKQTRSYVGILLSNQHQQRRQFEGVLRIYLYFYFLVPTSLSDKKRNERVGKLHCFKPDLSNLVKFMEDVATGILFKDDCIISYLESKKLYDLKARTVMIVSEDL